MAIRVTKRKEEAPPWEGTKVAAIGQTTIKHEKTGAIVKEEVKKTMVAVPQTYANVGVKASRTIPLEEYASVKVEVSLYHPCAPNRKAIDDTYDYIIAWVDEKMLALTKDYNPAIASPEDE